MRSVRTRRLYIYGFLGPRTPYTILLGKRPTFLGPIDRKRFVTTVDTRHVGFTIPPCYSYISFLRRDVCWDFPESLGLGYLCGDVSDHSLWFLYVIRRSACPDYETGWIVEDLSLFVRHCDTVSFGGDLPCLASHLQSIQRHPTCG